MTLRGAMRLGAALCLVVATVLALPPASASTSGGTAVTPAVVGPLRTSGNQILDGNGNPVVLRGVATEWLNHQNYTYAGGELDGADIDAARAWGATVYRVFLGSQFWNRTQCEYSATYAATVKRVVDRITANGMVALIDLHWNTRLPCVDTPGQKQMADLDAVSYWRSVATTFKDNPLVAFDLYNEPHDISWDVWRDGGILGGGPSPYTTPFKAIGMQELYDTVRATGATNLVFVSGNDWANSPPPDTHLISGSNIVYAVHYYSCPNSLPVPQGTCTAANPYDPAAALDRWADLAGRQPVMLTEFGWGDPNDGRYATNTIAWAERHGVGWIAMDFAHVAPGFNLGLFDALGSFQPTPGNGQAVQDALAAAAPSGLRSTRSSPGRR